jgi:hypothetical protein
VFFAWVLVGLASLWPVSQLVEGTFPALTVVWLLVPLAALAMPQPQGFLFAEAYAFVGIGLIGGWAAARTRSIWPGLLAAVALNTVLTAVAMW